MRSENRLGNDRHLTMRYTFLQCCYNLIYCVMYYASVFLLSRGFQNAQVGIVLTIANGLSIVLQPIVAGIADRSSKISLKYLLAGIVAIGGFLAVLLWLLPEFLPLTAVLYVLFMLLVTAQTPLLTSVSMEHINKGARLNFSLARGIGSFAFAVLALSLGFLVDGFGAWVIMPICAGVTAVYVVLAVLFPSPKGQVGAKKTGMEKEKALSFGAFAKKYKRFALLVLSVVFTMFSHVFINSYAIQIVRSIGGDSSEMGAASALAGFLELPAMALFPLILKKLKRAGKVLKISAVAFFIKGLITLLAPNMTWFYVAQCFQFFAFALYVPSSVYYTNRIITGGDKVKGQAFMGLAAAISGMLGNFLGGFMLDSAGGVRLMMTVGCIVSLIGVVMLFVVIEKDDETMDAAKR